MPTKNKLTKTLKTMFYTPKLAVAVTELAKCPGGADHTPAVINVGYHFWVECQTCHRESYAVQSVDDAAAAWSSDVGMPGRSNLIQSLRSTSLETA